MIERYENPKISAIFSDENKLEKWQETELAVIQAKVNLEGWDIEIYKSIKEIWESIPIDIDWWKKRDNEIHHDLNAFIDERVRHLPQELQQYVHKKITSFDTEEPAFHRMLKESIELIKPMIYELEKTLISQAIRYRYTIMMARTHGQEAELQSFGARILSWLKDLRISVDFLNESSAKIEYCKLSGAIGKYGSIDPKIEVEALAILGLKPFYGATQIMPRSLYAPLAQSITNMMMSLNKIALDIRLGSRSGRPIYQEPFGKKQKGSSAMPHKKNTIRTEQIEGLARMAKGFCVMIMDNIETWEERAIEQSCVERVAWPDLFHVLSRSLSVSNQVIGNMKVYRDNMLLEVYDSRGVYASSEVKEFIKERIVEFGGSYEDAYRIVQLACFNVFEAPDEILKERLHIPISFDENILAMKKIGQIPKEIYSIQELIPSASLFVSEALDIDQKTVNTYNHWLRRIFDENAIITRTEWDKFFKPSFLLKNEDSLYQEIVFNES